MAGQSSPLNLHSFSYFGSGSYNARPNVIATGHSHPCNNFDVFLDPDTALIDYVPQSVSTSMFSTEYQTELDTFPMEQTNRIQVPGAPLPSISHTSYLLPQTTASVFSHLGGGGECPQCERSFPSDGFPSDGVLAPDGVQYCSNGCRSVQWPQQCPAAQVPVIALFNFPLT